MSGAITWAVQRSASATVSSIEIQVSQSELKKPIAQVADIEIGERIADLNFSAIASKITELPQVRAASVSRRWPDRIVISVDLRQPIGWFNAGLDIYYLDSTGEKYDPRVSVPRTGLPAFKVANDELLGAITTAYFDFPDTLQNKIVEISASSSSNIRFKLNSDVTIIWGSDERGSRKAEVLEVLLQRKAKTYDVSAPDLPTIRLN
jgi:cell division protein FtsQ